MPDKASSIIILKELARDITRSPEEVAEDLDMQDSLVRKVVSDFIYIATAVMDKPGFPQMLLDHYKDPQNESQLSVQEIEALMPILHQHLDSLKKQADLEAKQQMSSGNPGFNPNQPSQQQPGNGFPMINPWQQAQQQQQDESQMPQGNPLAPDPVALSTNAGLLSALLDSQVRVHPNAKNAFMRQFMLAEDQMLSNPAVFKDALTANFGPQIAAVVTNLFMMLQPKYVGNSNAMWSPATSLSPGLGGMMQQPGMGGGMGGMGMPQLPPGMQMTPQMWQWYMEKWFDMQREAEEDRKAERAAKRQERQLSQYTNMLMSTTMSRMLEAQTPMTGGQGGFSPMGMAQAVEETLDANGKVVGRRVTPVPVNMYNQFGQPAQQQQNPVMEQMLRTISEERNTLLKAFVDNGGSSKKFDLNETILNGFLSLVQNKTDPISQIKELREVAPEIFGQREGLSLDALKLKFDTDMKMLETKMGYKKMEHEWQREDNEKVLADKNMDRLLQGVSTIGNQILGPALNTAVAAWAQGSAAKRGAAAAGAAQQAGGSGTMSPNPYGQVPTNPYGVPPEQQNPYLQQPSVQQQNPMASYQPITDDVIQRRRQQLASATNDELDKLAKEQDMLMSEVQIDSQLAAEERRKRRAKQQGQSVQTAQGLEANANPNIISDASAQAMSPMPPGADPRPV